MHSDAAAGRMPPAGARLAGRGQVASAWFLGLALFIATLGVGYLAWSLAGLSGDHDVSGVVG
ncbi:MAG TPA: hypothetical protein VMF87_23205 [Streptosporangiaceae bacterium]|nr:hypothetical protein [Streptosporangiaceae bacterium]